MDERRFDVGNDLNLIQYGVDDNGLQREQYARRAPNTRLSQG